MVGLEEAINTQTTQAIDTSDILRAAIVLAISALDHFVHEFVRAGMLEILNTNRPPTDKYLNFRVPIGKISSLSHPDAEKWLDQQIREQHSWQSFQSPEKLADALRLITSTAIWPELGCELGMEPQEVRASLALIVNRRNQIAHEADLDLTNPRQRWPIDAQVVQGNLNFVEHLAEAINSRLSCKRA